MKINIIKKYKTQVVCFVLLIISMLCCFFENKNILTLFAEDGIIKYSNVLEDLKKDSNFNQSDYAVDLQDYSLKVIQVAESVNNELFVYVYQPCSPNRDLTATTINISTTIKNNLNFLNYDLFLINSKDCLYKYKVVDFQINTDTKRYYEISSIFRKWNEEIDIDLEKITSNTISEVAFNVGKQFVFTNTSNGVSFECSDIETIQISSKYVGFVRYNGKSNFWGDDWHKDCHFVAFTTDKKIDKLKDASIYFEYNNCHWQQNGNQLEVSRNDGSKITSYNVSEKDIINFVLSHDCSPNKVYKDIADNQTFTYESGHWSYTRGRISSVDDFVASENFDNTHDSGIIKINQYADLTEESKNNISSKDWVLRFFETDYITHPGWYGGSMDFSVVYNVSILRLEFETDGITYNLGIIDNKTTGSVVPDNQINYTFEISDWLKMILGLLALILLVVLFSPFLLLIFEAIIWFIKMLFKVIKTIFTLPIKIFKKRK